MPEQILIVGENNPLYHDGTVVPVTDNAALAGASRDVIHRDAADRLVRLGQAEWTSDRDEPDSVTDCIEALRREDEAEAARERAKAEAEKIRLAEARRRAALIAKLERLPTDDLARALKLLEQ